MFMNEKNSNEESPAGDGPIQLETSGCLDLPYLKLLAFLIVYIYLTDLLSVQLMMFQMYANPMRKGGADARCAHACMVPLASVCVENACLRDD